MFRAKDDVTLLPMIDVTLPRAGARNLQFRGVLLAEVESKRDGVPRWTRLSLYQSETAKLVAVECGMSSLDGEKTRFKAWIADAFANVHHQPERWIVSKFGWGELAKKLYQKLGIDTVERV